MSILGCGWLGFPTAKHLIKKGFQLKGSTTSIDKLALFKNNKIAPYLITLEAPDNEVLTDFLYADILIIALPSKNIDGFSNLLHFIKKSPIKKIIFISSTSVYLSENNIVTELSNLSDSPLITIENLFLNLNNLQTTIIRFAGLFGYDRKPGNFFKNGRKIPNPKGFVNMIHQDDCVAIIENIITQNCWGEIFNACADSHPTRKDFYVKTANDIGQNTPIFNETEQLPFKIISNKKLKQQLNFHFKYPDLLAIDYNAKTI